MIISSRKLSISLFLASIFYILAFFLLDKYGVLYRIRELDFLDYLVLVLLFLISIFFRYIRWYFLLKNQGKDSQFLSGFLRYSAGFLYTATPGKVGELSRIYFYRNTSVDKVNIFTSFIIERTFDLIVVLMLSSFFLINDSSFEYVIVAVVLIILIISTSAIFSSYLKDKVKINNKFINLVFDVLESLKKNMSLKIFIISIICGVIAWSLTSYILIYILYSLGFMVDFNLGLISIYPISMLAGALTFIPGGLGTTETTIAYTLNYFNIGMANAFLVAVLSRFSTIWIATIMGLICSWYLSFKKY